MQGFIIKINKVKDEDLIVSIVSQKNLDTLYRFYGARHSNINLGFLCDYEKEDSLKSNISRLRDVIHIGFNWIHDYKRLKLWQDFVSLFYPNLKDVVELNGFYFKLLYEASQLWGKQNPKRVAIESYVKLLEFEGRLHSEHICFLCTKKIEQNSLSLLRAYLPTHKECSHKKAVSLQGIDELYKTKSTFFLDDKECEILWDVMMEGF